MFDISYTGEKSPPVLPPVLQSWILKSSVSRRAKTHSCSLCWPVQNLGLWIPWHESKQLVLFLYTLAQGMVSNISYARNFYRNIFINFFRILCTLQCILIIFIPSLPSNSSHIHVNLPSLLNFMSFMLLLIIHWVHLRVLDYSLGTVNLPGATLIKKKAHHLDAEALEPLLPPH